MRWTTYSMIVVLGGRMSSQESSSHSPQTFRSEQRQVTELPDFMVGTDTVSVTIRPSVR